MEFDKANYTSFDKTNYLKMNMTLLKHLLNKNRNKIDKTYFTDVFLT